MADDNIVLEAKNITKQFPGVLANDHVNFDLRKGEIHALLGENGAGKTTLMNILYGLHKPDSGEVCVNGKSIVIDSPKDRFSPASVWCINTSCSFRYLAWQKTLCWAMKPRTWECWIFVPYRNACKNYPNNTDWKNPGSGGTTIRRCATTCGDCQNTLPQCKYHHPG